MANMAPVAPVSNYCHWGSKTETLRQPDRAPTQEKKGFQNSHFIGYLQRLPKKLKCTLLSSPPLFSVWRIATFPNGRKQQNEKYVSVCVCMCRRRNIRRVFTRWLAPGGVIRIWRTSYWPYLSFSARILRKGLLFQFENCILDQLFRVHVGTNGLSV